MQSAPTNCVIILLAIMAWPLPASAQTGDIAVITNANNPAVSLSLADLRKMFIGDKRVWPGPGNLAVKPILRDPASRENRVLLRLVGMSQGDFKQYWTAQVFRGDAGSEPPSLSFGMTLEAAKAFPGALALVDAGQIKPGMFVKVLRINGRTPGDEGYPLH
jgi:hypothetical protein